ncbi:MAG: MATE family efflux transporter, partial [Muribaculaceae bacterium]|nr:MATE family efflux transporter [Muribaculaceae bacterium]
MEAYNYRRIWGIAFPILVSLAMEQLINLTDTAFMGRVGEVELGASAIAGVMFLVIFMVGHGFCTGAQILIARRNGEGRFADIGNVFYQGIYFVTALAAVLFLLSSLFVDDILRMIVASDNVARKASEYMQWRVYGFFFAFAGGMFRSFYVGTTLTKTLTLNSVVMVVSNIVFNYALIFGHFGCPKMGIGGAALGSTLAEAVSVVFFIAYTRYGISYKKYSLQSIPRFSLSGQRRILRLSVWVMIQSFISISTWFIFFIYIEHLGEEALAVTNIVRSLSGLTFMTVMAFASACSSIVSNLIGEGHSREVWPTIMRHVKLTYLVVIPVLVVISLFPKVFLAIFTDVPQLVDASVASLWVMASSYLFLVPANCFFSSVSGTGQTRTAFRLELLSLVVYMAYITITIYWMRVDVAL